MNVKARLVLLERYSPAWEMTDPDFVEDSRGILKDDSCSFPLRCSYAFIHSFIHASMHAPTASLGDAGSPSRTESLFEHLPCAWPFAGPRAGGQL